MMGRIHVFPAWEQNPYLNMLYVGARCEGWHVEGSKNVKDLAVALSRLGDGDVLHIHWTSPILHERVSEVDAAEAVAHFSRLLDGFRMVGGRVIWTVHNALAHDAQYPELEIEIARVLASRSDRIIQLNSQTRAVVSNFYDIPFEKLVTLRHASYDGIYADPPGQHEARTRLGISDTAVVVGFVGQMRAYKGIPTLLRAMEQARDRIDDLTLVLAGKTPPEDVKQIDASLPKSLPVVREHSFISDSEIGTWFAACDVMAFPYERILNSGSVLLSATFAKPCILPAEPHLVAEYGDQAWVTFYDTDADAANALAEAIPVALEKGLSATVSAQKYSDEYTTYNMAWDYVAILEEMFSTPHARGYIPS